MIRIPQFLITLLLLSTACFSVTAEQSTPSSAEPSRVMLFGVFHFANPGRDLVSAKQINVMTEENQIYLKELAQRIAEFEPTHVLIECDPENSAEFLAKFKDFQENHTPLGSNENYQLGFRVANMAGLTEIICYDASFDWQAQQLFDYMASDDPATKQEFDGAIARLTAEESENHQSLSLKQLLALSNDPARDRENMNLYLLTNAVGAGDGFAGADAAASWWQRNFRMYANIQKVAEPGTRLVVFGGQGHTAILKDLLAIDMKRKAEPIISYLD